MYISATRFSLFVLVAAGVFSGCEARVRAVGPQAPNNAQAAQGTRPEPSVTVRQAQDARRDARTELRTGWDKLGERMVDGKADRDTIVVGRADGKFTRIQIIVEMSSLVMDDVVVTFGDGTTFSPATRQVFAENSKSRVIDLPGGARVIRKVEFKYGNLTGGGRAQVELWGK